MKPTRITIVLLIIVVSALPVSLSHTTPSATCDTPLPIEEIDHWSIWTDALIQVESGGDDYAVGRTNDFGCLQITPILVKEVNRIQSERKFTIKDAMNRDAAIQMFNIIQEYYNPEKDRHLALKIWNPRAPISYHSRVEAEYARLVMAERERLLAEERAKIHPNDYYISRGGGE